MDPELQKLRNLGTRFLFLLISVSDKIAKIGCDYEYRYLKYDWICPRYDQNNIFSIVFYTSQAQPGLLIFFRGDHFEINP